MYLRNKKERGFTLLEMMTVIMIFGVISGMIAVRMDFFGRDAQQELEQLQGFLKAEHSEVLRSGKTSRVRFIPQSNIVKVSRIGKNNPRTFQLDNWELKRDEAATYQFTPSGVFGPDSLQVKNQGSVKFLKSHRLMGLTITDSKDA